MGAEDDARAGGNFVQFFDKDSAGASQLIHDVTVVDNFLAHVNGSAIEIKGYFDNVDGSHNSGAKPSWPQQDNLLTRSRHKVLSLYQSR
jgi:hypothetical protein